MDIKNISAVILSGGFSSRMGTDKAELVLGGKTLLQIQIDKMKQLGIDDIMLSGYKYALEGTRTVADVYPHRGPVSGVHACLLAAKKKACLVISVDVPLIPVQTLARLIEAHRSGITVLRHGEKREPLMAVYDASLAPAAEEILMSEKTAMRKLLDMAELTEYIYEGDELLLLNCNTPEQFAEIKNYQY